MTQYIFELIGTLALVLLGDGVCAAVTLNKSKAQGAGWVVITLAWGFAVMVGVLIAGPVSGAHLNPAVTLGLALAGTFAWNLVPGYIIAQMIGGFLGAAILIFLYGDHIAATDDDATIRGCFCTGPSIRNMFLNFCSEFVATFVLVFTLASIPANSVTVGDNVYAIASNANWVLVYGVIVACGASFGGLTGYAMNAARDSAPRFAYQVLAPNKGHKDADWGYGWIPAVAPICGGAVASFVYMALQSMGG